MAFHSCRQFARVDLCLAIRIALRNTPFVPPSFGLDWREQIRIIRAIQERAYQIPPARAKRNLLGHAQVARLVLLRTVDPQVAAPINVTRTHDGYFGRPHAGNPLQLHHRRDLRRQERQSCFNDLIIYRPHRRALPRSGSAGLQSLDGSQPFKDERWNQFLGNSPAEHSLDASNPLVDFLSAELLNIDHVLANGLERMGAEVSGRDAAIEFLDRPNGQLEIDDFFRRSTIDEIVALGVIDELQQEFVDEQALLKRCRRNDGLSSIGQPFRNQAVVLLPRFRRIVGAEVMVSSGDADDGLT